MNRRNKMVGTKNNRRAQLTKKNIQDALIHLMSDKNINSISVTDICKTADINRGTFYAHFVDVADCMNHMEKETANELFSILENDKQTDSVEVLLQAIFELVKKNNKVSNFILTEDQDFLANILSTTKQKFFNQLVPDDDTLSMSEKQFLYEYTLNGVVGMIRHWIKSDMKESPKTLTSYFNKWCYQS